MAGFGDDLAEGATDVMGVKFGAVRGAEHKCVRRGAGIRKSVAVTTKSVDTALGGVGQRIWSDGEATSLPNAATRPRWSHCWLH